MDSPGPQYLSGVVQKKSSILRASLCTDITQSCAQSTTLDVFNELTKSMLKREPSPFALLHVLMSDFEATRALMVQRFM